MEQVKIKPRGSKCRFGYRGKKLRYSVFKAEWNQKWLPFEQGLFLRLCEKHELNPEDFLCDTDNPNRKWSYALHRLRKVVYPSVTSNPYDR